MTRRLFALVGLSFVAASAAFGQAKPPQVFTDSITVVAESAFGRSRLRRWLLGQHYRDLWVTPVRVPVLDLGQFAGGLKPVERGGGLQTKSIRLEGADGRQYQFRLVRKDPDAIVPEDLQGTFIGGLVRDQMSAIPPAGALAVAPIQDAAGVLHAPAILVYMPDDPRLGEFRADFGGQLGTIEERPRAGEEGAGPDFAGAKEIKGTAGMYEDLLERPWVKVDTRAFLTVRLIDFLVGDWDRHDDQYRWALLGEGDNARWVPIPRDRDQAFARYDGLLLGLARIMEPKLVVFDEKYPSPYAATFNGRHVDRRLLNDLEWPVWDSVVKSLQARITDQVIDQSVTQLPPEYQLKNGDMIRRILKARRDGLPEAAQRYYLFLAEQAIIHGGNTKDSVEVIRHPDGKTEVRLSGGDSGTPYYARTFLPDETDEIRIYIRGGDDRAVVRGQGDGPLVRLVGGDGQDVFTDQSGSGNVRFYDSDDGTVADGEDLDKKPYQLRAYPPETEITDTNPELYPEQDWGRFVTGAPIISIKAHHGLAGGIRISRQGFGFRRQPYASLHTASLEYSTMRTSVRFQGNTRWRQVNSHTYFGFLVLASGIEGGRFYGFGNDSPGESLIPDRFLVLQHAYGITPYVGWGLETRTKLWLMLPSRHTVTNLNDPTNAIAVIDSVRPLGVGDFGQFGVATELDHDTRDFRFTATKGIRLVLAGDYYPVTWGKSEGAFGSVEGRVSTYLTPVQPVTLALRVGGRRVWGDFPFFESAFLGGKRSLRGYHTDRFAGEGSVFGNAELRLQLFTVSLLIPTEVGIFGLADAGRIFFEDDSTDKWRTDFGGGITLAVRERRNGFTLGAAKGSEGVRIYFSLGTSY